MLAVMLLTIVCCMLMTGCGSGKARTESQMKRVAEKLLEEKYDEEFEIHYAWPRDSSLFYATCSPKDDMDIVFEIQAYNDGRGLYRDEYIQGIVSRQLSEKLENELQNYFEECFVHSIVFYQECSIENVSTVTIEEFLTQCSDAECLVDIYVDEDKLCEDKIANEYSYFAEVISQEIEKGLCPKISVGIHYVDAETKGWCQEYFKTNFHCYGDYYSKIGAFYEIGFGYPEGIINKSLEEYKELRTRGK